MKFTLDASSRVNLIRSYSDRGIQVGEQVIRRSCIITADAILSDWAPDAVTELTADHLAPILALEPEVVLLGTGASPRFPPAEIRAAFLSRRIGLETMDLGAACRTFNILVQEERRVVAALFLK